MKTTVLRRAMVVLLSAALVTSFVPAQGLADSVSLVGPSAEASASSDGRLDGESGSPSAADAIATADSTAAGAVSDDAASAPAPADGAAAAPAPGASESDVAGAPAPAGPTSAPLVNIIEADAAGNPHAQMYTTLLDKDGKVVDTNDPSRTVNQRYKPVDQGGVGAGLSKGDGVTVRFRMAAVTPNNADGEGTGVQEDTTYPMDLPWQLVAAKQDKRGNKLVDPDAPLDFFNSGDMAAKGGIYSKLDSDGNPAVNSTGDPLYELRIDFANVADHVDISGEFQYTTTVSENVTSGSVTSLTYVPGGTVSFKVNDDPTPGIDGEYQARVGAGSGGPTSYYANASLSKLESDYRWLDNSGGYAMSDGTASTFMTGGADPGTQIVGMTGSNYWQFAGTVSVGQVKGDSNLVSNSCFASGSNGGSSSDAKLQYQLKKVFADADSSQQLVVYRSVDQDGNLLRNSYGDVMYIVVDPRTCANAQQQQSISGNNWYNYRAERKSNGVDSSKGGSWRLHVFNAPQLNLQMTFPQYEGSFDVSDQARSGGTISDRVQAGNGSFSADSRVANEISYGANTQQASYMDSEWVNDDTIFWKMTLNVDNWQNWSDGRLYVAADMPLQVIGAPSGAKVSGFGVEGGYAFAKQSDGSWKSIATGMGGGVFCQASWDEMCDGTTLAQSSDNSNFCISINISNASNCYRDSSSGNTTITVGFFTKVTGSSLRSDGSYGLKAQLVCHTGDPSLIAGAGHCSWPTYANGVNSLGQWAYRVSAGGSAHAPSLSKYGSETASSGDSSNIATTWTLAAYGFNTSSNHASHTSSLLVNAYYGGWAGRFAIGDTMSSSAVSDASGNVVDVDAGKYTQATRMFPSYYPSVSENRNGGGCGPIPSKGMGGDSWEKYVDGEWKAINSENCYWDADAPGVYRKILTTSSGGGTANSESNPLAVYVYYAGNMSDRIAGAVGGGTLLSVGANPGDPTYFTSSLAIEYRGLEQVGSAGNDNKLDYQTELDAAALSAAATPMSRVLCSAGGSPAMPMRSAGSSQISSRRRPPLP